MKKQIGIILFPVLMVVLAGAIYVQTGLQRTIQAADQALADGDPLHAGELLASVAEQHPPFWEQAGEYALQAEDRRTALVYFQNAEAVNELSGKGYLALGDLYLQKGDTQLALAAWENAFEKRVPALEVYYRFLEVHQTAKDVSAIIEDLRAISGVSPEDAQSKYQLGLILTTRDPESALAYLDQAAEIDESLAEGVRQLRRSFRPSTQTDDPAFTWVNVGQTLASLGEWERAREAFALAVGANPEYAEAWAFLGEAKGQVGEDGLEELDTALNLNPASLTANLLYALYQKRNGKLETALVYFHAADMIEPGNPSIQIEIGNTLNEMGKFNEGLSYFQKAVELAPREPAYWHLLAQYSFQNNTLIEEVGLEAARQALLINDQDPVALDLMGFGYYLLNDMPTAQRFLLQALEITTDDPNSWYHLGLVFLALGELQNAQNHFLKTIELAPDSNAAEQARRILSQYFP